VKRKCNFITKKLIMFCVAFVAFDANAFWMVDSNTPTAAQVSADFKGENGSLVGVFLTNFISERNCNPEVAFINFEGEKLGIPVAQELADWKMTIWVDGKVVWHEKTGINDYVNGFETGGAHWKPQSELQKAIY